MITDLEEAKALVLAHGCPAELSISHDMGDRGDGLRFARWFCGLVLQGELELPDGFRWTTNGNDLGAVIVHDTMENLEDILPYFIRKATPAASG